MLPLATVPKIGQRFTALSITITQSNETSNRLDRIEAIILELATTSVRHDNTLERLEHLAEQQQQQIGSLRQRFEDIADQQEANAQQIALNREDINTLTASIQKLCNLVADYI
jgi:chromosome segregation ATPase